MLPFFVILLREGLEAVLIVSIIASFLKSNGASLRPMWIGVGLAVALSLAVGVVLNVVEESLPQRQQEMMETVIGAIAVFFVTGMILWMRTHARHMKRELEKAATSALGAGTARALAVMAFIAVLREGFETSVFLLSTFKAADSTLSPIFGAVLGLWVAIAIGVGLYVGAVSLNLAKFFTYTGVFLVLVAAGLVLSALRTAHEAGWVNVGQGTTVDLGWLAPVGAVRTSLISGVLGIPADPRVIELLGWALYLVPMLALTLWPQSLRPGAALAARLRLGAAGAMTLLAVVLMVAVSYPTSSVASTAPLATSGTATIAVDGQRATLTITRGRTTTVLDLADPEPATGNADTRWHLVDGGAAVESLPDTLDLATLLTYTGQRIPVGIDATRNPGPYDATWRTKGDVAVTTRGGGLVTGSADGGLVLTLSGGGLTSSRVVSVDAPGGALAWSLSPDHVSAVAKGLADERITRNDRVLWKYWFPVVLLVAAALLVVTTLRRRRSSETTPPHETAVAPALVKSSLR